MKEDAGANHAGEFIRREADLSKIATPRTRQTLFHNGELHAYYVFFPVISPKKRYLLTIPNQNTYSVAIAVRYG